MSLNSCTDKIKLSYIETEYKDTGEHSHFHDEYSIIYVKSGNHIFENSSARYQIEENTIRIINPKEQHRTINSEWSYINFMVDKNYINSIMKNCFSSFKNEIKFTSVIKDSIANELFYKLNNLLAKNDSSNMEIDICTINFIEYLISNYTLNNVLKNDNIIKRIENINIIDISKDYIEKNYCEKISLEELAEAVNTNKFVLLNEFKKEMNITPYQYLLIVRANKAKKMILDNVPLSEIAYLCGFTDQSNMIKNFKKVFNYTPSLVKKSIQNFSLSKVNDISG